MEYLIQPQQCSFIAGRQGCDNVIIAQEAIHTMRSRKRKTGYVAVKVDMEKAYDRLDWGFLRSTLKGVGLKEDLISIIMACTSSISTTVLWNGEDSHRFQPTRDVRQGDPREER